MNITSIMKEFNRDILSQEFISIFWEKIQLFV